jgi:hypothetical protein
MGFKRNRAEEKRKSWRREGERERAREGDT